MALMATHTKEAFVIYGDSIHQFNIDKRGLGAFIFDACCKYENKIFQVIADADISETYSSVKSRSIRLAMAMSDLGVTSNDIVSICSQNTTDNLIPIIACLFLGVKPVSLDPHTSKDELKHLLNIVKPKLIFLQQDLFNTIQECSISEKLNSVIIVMEDTHFENMLQEKPNEDSFTPIIVDSHETAFIFFSSGSTSLPVAVCVSHYALLHSMENHLNQGFKKYNGFLSVDSTYWATEISVMLMIFKTGGYRVINTEHFSNFEHLLKIFQNYRVTFALFSSSMTHLFNSPNLKKYDLTKFKTMGITGSKLSSEQLADLRTKFPYTNIVFSYGQTEIQLAMQFHMVRDKKLYLKKPGSVGKPINGVAAKIVDIHTNEALGPNKKGELRIKSPSFMNGYYNSNKSSLDEYGYHKTGDIAYYDEEECFYIINRITDVFKFQDWTITPFFIEQCIMKHEAVAEAVVFGIPHEFFGELVAALVTLNRGYTIKNEELIKFTNSQLIDKDKIRGGLKIVTELPKTCTHKIIRKKARQIFLEMMDNQ